MKEEKEKKKGEERQLVAFYVANEEFGVDINRVNGIIKLDKVTRIPNSEVYVEGVINLRGKIIVVINLAKKLHLPEKAADKSTRIIVVEVKDDLIGMIVDSVSEVLRMEKDKISEAPPVILEKIDADYLDGVGILGERLMILLDIEKVLHKHELESIKSAGEKAAKAEVARSAEAEAKREEVKPAQPPKPAQQKSATESKPEAKATPKEFKDAKEGEYFWFHNGTAVKNAGELLSELERMDDHSFSQHVNKEKNDFASWIRNVLSDEDLAKSIEGKTTKQEIVSVLKEMA